MLLSRKRVILAKIETTYGTDPTPTGPANAILVRNLDVKPLDADLVSRDIIRNYLGSSEQLIAAKHATATFEVELQGAGAAGTAPAYGPLLRACGMSETVTASVKVDYKPISSTFESVTIYFQPQDATSATSPLHKMTGARGSVEFALNSKSLPVMKFTFTGLYVAVADATNLVGTYTAFKTPNAVNKDNTPTFSFFGYSAIMSEFNVALNNDVVYRNLVGSESVIITDRKAGGSTTFEAPLIATKDFFSTALGTALGSLQITHGATAGSIVDISATSTVDVTAPSYGDMDGIVMMTVPFLLVPTTAGNDEFTLSVK